MDIHLKYGVLEHRAKGGDTGTVGELRRWVGTSTAASSTTAAKSAGPETVGRWAGTPNVGSSTHD